jgi:hypothetical protein
MIILPEVCHHDSVVIVSVIPLGVACRTLNSAKAKKSAVLGEVHVMKHNVDSDVFYRRPGGGIGCVGLELVDGITPIGQRQRVVDDQCGSGMPTGRIIWVR